MVGAAVFAAAQNQSTPSQVGAGTSSISPVANLPVQQVGVDDLLGITVYDEPELTRTVRVDSEGDIRLPMIRKRVHAAGLYPSDLETAISSQLTAEQVMVEPIVTVSVVEYRSRPIKVVGAVKTPVTFQATGSVTLLDAIAQAQGLADNAGPDILVSRGSGQGDGKLTLIKRVPVKDLLSGDDPSLNVPLAGGEEIRVPVAGTAYVVGNVKKPGPFSISNGAESTVLKALSESQGLDSFPGHTAYIYRQEAGAKGRAEIPVDLKKIMDRKALDVALMDNDILYIPTRNGMKVGARVLEVTVAAAATIGAASIYAFK